MTTTINKEQKNPNVPNLRFPEFSGEWQEKRLSDIADFSKGIGISKDQLSADGEPCILYGELYTKYKSETIKEVISKTNIDNTKLVKSKSNDVIIPCSGETAEEIAIARCVLKDDILLGGDLNIIRLHRYDGSFMSYQLNGKRKYDIAKVAQGVSVVHLYGEHLKNIKTINPSLNEQKKIANLLSLLDERISTQNKIIEDLKQLKSAIAHKLLNDRMLLETRISLGEVCELKNGYAFRSSSYCTDGKYKILTIANVQGNRYISTEDCKSISYLPNDLQEHQILRDNDILISMTGNVGRVSLCSKGHYLLNQRVGLLVPKIKEIEFIFQVLATEHFEQSMIACGQGAAQMNIGKGDIDGYMLPFSCKSDNMNHIAKMLQAYDNCIDTNARLLEALILQKQCLLQQMFI
ncbi:MAG: restriction endonuclease subunit S [Prevotella sp.]|nr:restriction endonuclease subunit S [Prevotella sp.]